MPGRPVPRVRRKPAPKAQAGVRRQTATRMEALPLPDELARRAAELGFRTTAGDYSRLENRLTALRDVMRAVREIDVSAHEPAPAFAPGARIDRESGGSSTGTPHRKPNRRRSRRRNP